MEVAINLTIRNPVHALRVKKKINSIIKIHCPEKPIPINKAD